MVKLTTLGVDVLVSHLFPLLDLSDLLALAEAAPEVVDYLEEYKNWDSEYNSTFPDPLKLEGGGFRRFQRRCRAEVYVWGYSFQDYGDLISTHGLNLWNEKPQALDFEYSKTNYHRIWRPIKVSLFDFPIRELVSPFTRFGTRGETVEIDPQGNVTSSFPYLKITVGTINFWAVETCGHRCCDQSHNKFCETRPHRRLVRTDEMMELALTDYYGLIAWKTRQHLKQVLPPNQQAWYVPSFDRILSSCSIPNTNDKILDFCSIDHILLLLTNSGKIYGISSGIYGIGKDNLAGGFVKDPETGIKVYSLLPESGPRFRKLLVHTYKYFTYVSSDGYLKFLCEDRESYNLHTRLTYFMNRENKVKGRIIVGLDTNDDVYYINLKRRECFKIHQLSGIADIRGAMGNWLALSHKGDVYCCGSGEGGALGLGKGPLLDAVPSGMTRRRVDTLDIPLQTHQLDMPSELEGFLPYIVAPRKLELPGKAVNIASLGASATALVVPKAP